MPQMVRIENRPLVRTGIDYPLSTGPKTFTEEDLKAAVAAIAQDPAVHAPRIKIDGLAESFDPNAHGGEPALGWVEDLAVSDDGQTLTGTMVVPEWLEAVAPFAYPQLSVEGLTGARTVTGQQHDLIITAVALLGVDLPGVSTLPDLAEFLANGPAGSAPTPEVIAAKAEWQGDPVRIRAGMDQEIVRRRLIEWMSAGADGDLPDGNESPWDLWPVALRFDDGGKPYAKVLDEGTGRLYRVDVKVSGNDVTFGKFVEVVEQDVPVAAAAGERPAGTVWASRADVRPTPTEQESDMTPEQIKALRDRLGLTEDQLPDDATADQITEALRIPEPESEKDDDEVPTPKADEVEPIAAKDGTVTVSATVWREQTERLGRVEASEKARTEAETKARRDRKAADAVRATKIAPSERDHYRALWDVDEEKTDALVASLASGRVPVGERGVEPQQDGHGAADNQGTGLFPTLAKREG